MEERDTRVCAPAAGLPTLTPTPTITPTVTDTVTPTPTQTPTCRVSVYNMRKKYDGPQYSNYMGATITNDHTSRDTAFDHARAQRAGIKINKAFMHHGRAFG